MKIVIFVMGGLIVLISISSIYIIQADGSTDISGSFEMNHGYTEWSEQWKIGYTSSADVSLNMNVGPEDISGVAAHYMESGNPGWILADVNDNGEVGPEDLSGIAAHYMESY